jgi:hypothetical protein
MRLKPFGDRITVKEGDLLNSADLEQVVKGHDAVSLGILSSSTGESTNAA